MIRRTNIELKCSFCGRTARQCKVLINDGPGKPAICGQCVEIAYGQVQKWKARA